MHNPDLPPEIAARLADYRRQIDAIDDQLIALLKQRIGIVAQVGKMKREESPLKNFIRSGREAVMVKRIYEEFRGTEFLSEAAAQIWRLLIAASIHHEAPLTLALTSQFSAVAAEYFGSFMPQVACVDAKASLARAAVDKQTIAVIAPEEAALLAQAELQSLKIFALLPFIPSPNLQPKAYAVAQLIPEETGRDVSVFFTDRVMEIPGYHMQPPLDISAKISHSLWLGSYATPIGESHARP
jgi:chorismate mutase